MPATRRRGRPRSRSPGHGRSSTVERLVVGLYAENAGSADEDEGLSFASLFCPRSLRRGGLAEGYVAFQAFDTLQALCSYLRSVLCTQALMQGLGVGREGATALGASLTFLTRDGAGMLGGLGLAWLGSRSFGKRVREWRLFADIVNDVALALDLWAPRFAPGNGFVALVCVSSILKAWCGVAAGATRAAITGHFALRKEDLADVAAKEGSQETAVTLLGMILGYVFLRFVSDPSDTQTYLIWALFWFLTLVHILANYAAIRSIRLRTLNWERLDIVVQAVWKDEEVDEETHRRHVRRIRRCTPNRVASQERLFSFVVSASSGTADDRTRRIPRFGTVNEDNRELFVRNKDLPFIGFHDSVVIVDDRARAVEVVGAGMAFLRFPGNAAECAQRLPECVALARILEEEADWDFEDSRALLGDVVENRVVVL